MQVDVQFVDWGALIGMLGLLVSVVVPAVGLLWRAIATQMKSLNGRLDKQDQDMAELKSDVGELKTDMAVVQNDLGHVKDDLGHLRNDFRRLESRCDLMDTNIVQIMRDVGRLEGGQRGSSPKERVGAGGS